MKKLLLPLLLTTLVAAIPFLGDWLKKTRFAHNPRDVDRVADSVQAGLCWPWGSYVDEPWLRVALALPWFILVFWGLRLLHKKVLKGRYRNIFATLAVVWLLLRIFPDVMMLGESDDPSRSIGTVSNGRLENGKRIPYQGKNYRTYSFAGYLAGRTFVHEKVRAAVLEAYAEVAETMPEQEFVLMETGRRFGGQFLPHRTHRNGLSVDFMTPMRKQGEPWVSSGLFNLWAYGRNFDDTGKKGAVEIDYKVMAEHIAALEKAAKNNGLDIKKIIFDPVLQPYLAKTKKGRGLKQRIYFTRGRVIPRHDDHYHVDFEVRKQ